MDLPDCPPGTEGYEEFTDDKPDDKNGESKEVSDVASSKNAEIDKYLQSKTIQLEDGTTHPMFSIESRNNKSVFLCHPCGATCMDLLFMQNHLNGKKHTQNMQSNRIWPNDKIASHPFYKTVEDCDKDQQTVISKPSEIIEGEGETSQLMKLLNTTKRLALGLEYTIEIVDSTGHFPYIFFCVLCEAKGNKTSYLTHLFGYPHQLKYLSHHYPTAFRKLNSLKTTWNNKGIRQVIHDINFAIIKAHGLVNPTIISSDDFEENTASIINTIKNKKYTSERDGHTFEELVDEEYISKVVRDFSNAGVGNESQLSKFFAVVSDPIRKVEPSPPKVAPPSRNKITKSACLSYLPPDDDVDDGDDLRERINELRARKNSDNDNKDIDYVSITSGSPLSSISNESRKDGSVRRHYDERRSVRSREKYFHSRESSRNSRNHFTRNYDRRQRSRSRSRSRSWNKKRTRSRSISPFRTRILGPKFFRKKYPTSNGDIIRDKTRNVNFNNESRRNLEKWSTYFEKEAYCASNIKNSLLYHEKNPEKHPLYNEEWKKYWNKRYKELIAEGKDAVHYDFKPEWIVYWSKRMKELSDAELALKTADIRKQLGLIDSERPKTSELTVDSTMGSSRYDLSKNHSRSPVDSKNVEDTFKRLEREKSEKKLSKINERIAQFKNKSPPRKLARSKSPWDEQLSSAENAGPSSRPYESTYKKKRDNSLSREVKPHYSKSYDSKQYGSKSNDYNNYKKYSTEHGNKYRFKTMESERCSPDSSEDLNLVHILRTLTALENYLGSLGPKVISLLARALKMEKDKPNSSDDILNDEENCVLLETVKEKLKGLLDAGMIDDVVIRTTKKAIKMTASVIYEASEKEKKRLTEEANSRVKSPVKIEGIGTIDKAAIANEIAEALIAQGKTDVTTEELEVLINAVVGMSEGSMSKNKPVSTTSLLYQLNQKESKTFENNVAEVIQEVSAVGKEEESLSMEGLSDSDLKTLLQNFKDLSPSEQHGLIAYLKKLEAREPARVEKLRMFVDIDPTLIGQKSDIRPMSPFINKEGPIDPASQEKSASNALNNIQANYVSKANDSDDEDDYTYDEVLKTVSENVKKQQLAEEMQIIEKTLKETSKSETQILDTQEITRMPSVDAQSIMSNLLGSLQKNKNDSSNIAGTTATPQSIDDVLKFMKTVSSQNLLDNWTQPSTSLQNNVNTNAATIGDNNKTYSTVDDSSGIQQVSQNSQFNNNPISQYPQSEGQNILKENFESIHPHSLQNQYDHHRQVGMSNESYNRQAQYANIQNYMGDNQNLYQRNCLDPNRQRRIDNNSVCQQQNDNYSWNQSRVAQFQGDMSVRGRSLLGHPLDAGFGNTVNYSRGFNEFDYENSDNNMTYNDSGDSNRNFGRGNGGNNWRRGRGRRGGMGKNF